MADRALYVYGVVPATAPAERLGQVPGIDPAGRVALVEDGAVAALASTVPLDEFGEEAIQDNLRDPRWLADKARAHDDVLAAAMHQTTVLPFRFGAIYRDEQHIVDLLRERTDFGSTLSRLEGALELGVKASVDVKMVRGRLAAGAGSDDGVSAGRAYMQRKQRARDVDEEVERFGAECAAASHERLSAFARRGRLNAVRQPEDADDSRFSIMNGAYLVDRSTHSRFRDEVDALATEHAADGLAFEVTGPWPPYNFADEERPS